MLVWISVYGKNVHPLQGKGSASSHHSTMTMSGVHVTEVASGVLLVGVTFEENY